jgi:Protein of unknown function (DUF4238)
MGDPKRHHYVGQFLLEGWRGTDGKLGVYSRKAGRLVYDRHTPKHTAYEMNLYTIQAFPAADRQWVEKEVMSKLVDEPASKVLKRLIAGELRQLNGDERSAWARFMMAQWVRTPEELAKLYKQCGDILRANLDANPEEYLAARGDAPEPTLRQWMEARMPGYEEIITMTRMLPLGINNERPGTTIVNMFWEVVDLQAANVDLLTSDQPVIRFQGLASPDAAIMIPLDPRRLFIATHIDRRFREYPRTKLVKAANISTVRAAKTFVYSTGTQHTALAEKHLGRSPAPAAGEDREAVHAAAKTHEEECADR